MLEAVTATAPNSDLAVNEIQGYGSIAVPVGNPFSIRAVVRNAGIAAIAAPTVVTLTISGANTFSQTQTITSLGVGGTAVVSFPNISLTNVGANTVTVTLPNDDNNGNNTLAQAMTTSVTRFSFETPGAASGNSVFQAGPNGYNAAKITLNASRSITSVSALISSTGAGPTSKSSVGESVYGVVINAVTGALLGRSANYVITAADIDAFRTFTLTAPVTVPAGDVLIGMAQTPSSSPTLQFFPFGVQNETPNRPNTYFTGSAVTAGAPTPALATASTAVFKFPFGAETVAPATCAAPAGLAVTGTTSTSASFSFTAVPNAAVGYQIVYGAPGFTPGGAGSTTTATFTGTTYTLPGLASSTAYDFYIRAICSATDQSAAAGPVRGTTGCVAPTISSFPYAQNFDVVAAGQALPCGVTVSDNNNDGFTWQARGTAPGLATGNIARSAPNAMVYIYNSTDPTVGANDWFYTPALALTAGQRHRLTFYYRSAAAGAGLTPVERLEVKYGTAATPAGQTITLFTNNNITNTAYALASNSGTAVVADIVPAATGIYYIGFRAISLADQGFLAVDDVAISAPLATSAALGRAVSVFPNPSNSGVFNLDIRGANAKQPLAVEVTNLLGQRVYTGTAKDNFRTDVNLSALANGIYSLKVRNGSEYTVQQISIVK